MRKLIITIDLNRNPKAPAPSLKPLKEILHDLEELSINQISFSDLDLRWMPNLKGLELRDEAVSNDLIEKLKVCTKLHTLKCTTKNKNPQFIVFQLSKIKELIELKRLELKLFCPLNPLMLEDLKKIPELKLTIKSNLNSMERFEMYYTQICSLSGLKSLDITDKDLKLIDVQELSSCRQLENLSLRVQFTSVEFLESLAAMTSLKKLCVFIPRYFNHTFDFNIFTCFGGRKEPLDIGLAFPNIGGYNQSDPDPIFDSKVKDFNAKFPNIKFSFIGADRYWFR